MNEVFVVFLVLLLASSSYAAGRLHAQLGYRLGFRSGYRQGFGDGDRAARLYQRRQTVARSVPVVTEAPTVTSEMTVAPTTVAAPPASQAAPPAGSSRGRAAPGAEAHGGGVPRLQAPAEVAVRPTNRAAVMRGTMYHSTGVVAVRGGRHAHPE